MCFFYAVRIVPGELSESIETIEEDFKICAFVSFDLRVPCYYYFKGYEYYSLYCSTMGDSPSSGAFGFLGGN